LFVDVEVLKDEIVAAFEGTGGVFGAHALEFAEADTVVLAEVPIDGFDGVVGVTSYL
jgi:hypothetical protein